MVTLPVVDRTSNKKEPKVIYEEATLFDFGVPHVYHNSQENDQNFRSSKDPIRNPIRWSG